MTRVTDITIDAPGGPLPCFSARADDFPNPTVVVVHEWWGLDGHIQDVALRFSGEDFSAVAPDLYRGKQLQEPDEARKHAMELDRGEVLEDLRSTVAWLHEEGVERVGVVGFCMGGSLTMELAHTTDGLSAAVVFYGMTDLADRELRCPLIAHFGDRDRFSGEALDGLRLHLESQPFETDVFVYEGAGHAFFNDARDAFRPEAAELAWERTLGFLRTQLAS